MRFFVLLLSFHALLCAGVYYAKVEPVFTYTYKAAYAGEVNFSELSLEGKRSTGSVVVRLDDSLDVLDMKHAKEKLTALTKTATLTKQSIANSRSIVSFKEESFARMKDLKTKSNIEKENEHIALLNAKNQLVSLEQSLENTLVQIADISSHIALLNDKIEKKNIRVPQNFLIYKIHFGKGEYATQGAPLVEASDVAQAKLTIFLAKEDVDMARKGVVYLDGKKSDAKVDKIWQVADTQNISAYRCEILLSAPESFSILKKIEFKEN